MPPLTVEHWLADYRSGDATPETHLTALRRAIAADDSAWICVADESHLAGQLAALGERLAAVDGDIDRLPLYGVPFAVKDNIDVAGLPTTAGCPAFAYTPETSAHAVTCLQAAGAVLIGKTNLDQFATGLVGTRSPFGAVPNAFDERMISGGSSSGSAVVVALGQVPFALGTDTAGSGRVPAGFNNIVGLKATCGAISTRGVVPACRTLDCVSLFTLTVDDADRVADVLIDFDPADAYARPRPAPAAAVPGTTTHWRLGVPDSPEFFGDARAQKAFEAAVADWRALGAEIVTIDYAPFAEAAALLYQGPWIAERYAAVGEFIDTHPADADPAVAEIISAGRAPRAVDAFRAEYRLAELRRAADAAFAPIDALIVPTAPTIYSQAEIAAEPIERNSRLGTYTNFVNLLDCCALALPGGFRDDGLPAGITLIAPAWQDARLAALGRDWQNHRRWPLGNSDRPADAIPNVASPEPPPDHIRLAVVGAHLRGMPLNGQLTERDARFVEQTTTAPEYRLLALAGTTPPKPGLIREPAGGGAAIEVELWDVPVTAFGSFVALISAPLGIGTLTLADGREVKSFICEGWAADTARDVTEYGGWRAYIADQQAKANDHG
ncbi:allophanate hydrolase [Salinisphaera orenii MK-B5]|uniref:Allophanate hydrolase n=1 Tax=Salinisphaera orenii MK-B5 TaxID=856730 RepID=A0A423PIK8_9GAMM|nr:allophanate hydrolase [Salinisphaera orenii]ROO25384.1 allophanate hydrolase [Salinisphaera orenii MK-B5]